MIVLRQQLAGWAWQLRTSLKWLALIAPTAAAVGSACAFFLWSLDAVTAIRFDHPWLLYLLPLAGAGVGFLYHSIGRPAEGGNNLIMDQIHQAGGGVPRRMAPLILFGTLVTHLFGGSAGREGTAVQMGGSIASFFCRMLRLEPSTVRVMLMAGIAGGFGAVFGTPLAGAVFAMEVLMIGQVRYDALLPCLISAVVGDWTCQLWGARHTHYAVGYLASELPPASFFHLEPRLLAKVVVASAAFGFASTLFAELSHRLSALFKKLIPSAPLRPAVGGLLVIGLFFLAGTPDYLGLGVWSRDPHAITIPSFFHSTEIHYWSWLWKIAFTAVTLSAGFKGGEVTPLFFIGAALGNALSGLLGAPTDLFAALGFVAIFAGATNTPLACTIMGVELFGATHIVYIATACFLAYLFSGHSGIYLSQRIAVPKTNALTLPPEIALRQLREAAASVPAPHAAVSAPEPARADDRGNAEPERSLEAAPQEVGMLCVYFHASDKRRQTGLRSFLSSRPLYRELIDEARRAGLLNAHAHHARYGYSSGGAISAQDSSETAAPELTVCVELIAEKQQLEAFCEAHGELLADKVVVYRHVERWNLQGGEAVRDAAADLHAIAR